MVKNSFKEHIFKNRTGNRLCDYKINQSIGVLFDKLKFFLKNRLSNNLFNQAGNISIFVICFIIVISTAFLFVIDLSRIFTARLAAQNAANAAALAVGQKIIFFELQDYEIFYTAKEAAEKNSCSLVKVIANYDEVNVLVSKKIDFMFWRIFKILNLESLKVYSSSKVKITFPWDEKFNSCKRINFDF